MQNFKIFIVILYLAFHQSEGDNIRTVVDQPPFVYAQTGGSMTIECKVSFQSSSFSVFWTLGCEDKRLIGKEGRVTYESLNRVITISNLTEADSGIYCCLVETAEGKSARGNGTRLNVTKTSCSAPADTCYCEKGALLLTVEILRVMALIILIILLSIVIWKSCKTMSQ